MKKKKANFSYARYGYLFSIPFVVAYLIFSLYPTLYTAVIGFTDMKGVGKTTFHFLTENPFANFQAVLTSPTFQKAFGNTVFLKRTFFSLFLLFLIGIGVTVFSAFLQKKFDANYNPAIVFAEATTLKAEPKNSSEDVVTLHEGTKVFVLEELGNWKQVELTDKTKAWIDKEAIKEVKE